MTQALGVAVVGFGWMGRVHTQTYLRVPHHFPQRGVRPELVAVAAARELIRSGEIGAVTHVRIRLLSDYATTISRSSRRTTSCVP